MCVRKRMCVRVRMRMRNAHTHVRARALRCTGIATPPPSPPNNTTPEQQHTTTRTTPAAAGAGSSAALLAPIPAPVVKTVYVNTPATQLSKGQLAGLLLKEIHAWQRAVLTVAPMAALVGSPAAP